MKIQISSTRIIPDAITVWHEHGPEVDIVMDPKKLTFAPGSIEVIFAFHVLDHLFMHEIPGAIANWKECLQLKTGVLFVTVDDFEYIARALVAGDINIDMFNAQFTHPAQFTRDNLTQILTQAGFSDHEMRIWFTDVPNLFKKEEHELIVSAENV